jgi:hypothetical protein
VVELSTYAKIQTGNDLVLNIVVASSTDYFDPEFTWDDVTSVVPQPSAGWTYTSPGVYTSPVSAPTLAQAIAANLASATATIEAFVEGRYSLGTQNAFRNIYALATNAGLTNRAAYCLQLMTWGQSVVDYAATYMAAVTAMTSVAIVQATIPDFTALIAADPLVTPVAAIQISN